MQRRFSCVLLGLTLVLASGSFCAAADDEDAKEEAASTQPVPRWVLQIPPGHELLDAGNYKIICTPEDKPWVQGALQTITPATRPTTMPSDMLQRYSQNLQSVTTKVGQDFALADLAPVKQRLETELREELLKLDGFRPPVFYLVTTELKLKDLLKREQWTCPSLYYNRLADEVVYRTLVRLTTERPMDDTVLPVLIKEDQAVVDKQKLLQTNVRESQREIAEMISGRGMFLAQLAFIDSIMKDIFAPLNLKDDQQWLPVGLAGVMSADYAQDITGAEKKELLVLLAAELRWNPLRLRSIDLLHPVDPKALKKQYVLAYTDAYRRKSMRVAIKMVEDTGRAKLPELLKSLRDKPCADGSALVSRIKEIMGVDISGEMGAK